MNEFKIGDEVYFLVEEHGWGDSPSMICNFSIRKEAITEIHENVDDGYLLEVSNIEGPFRGDISVFKTKNQVIDSLKNLIHELEKSDYVEW